MEDGGWRDSILDPPSSILDDLVRLPLTSAAGAGEVEFEIVAFGVEHVNGVAAVAFDAAVICAEFLGGLQRGLRGIDAATFGQPARRAARRII